MKDPYQEMMEWVVSSTFFLLCFFVAVAFSGCTTHEVKVSAPQLDHFPGVTKMVSDCAKPSLAMPPIPQECVLDIRGDVLTASSQECEDLVRFYVRARSLLKPGAVATSSQP